MKKAVFSSYTLTPRPQTAQIGGLLFTIIVVVAVLHFAQDVLMPLALAVLLAFLAEAPVTPRRLDFKVLCLRAADHADEVAAELFVKLIEVQGIEASAASISGLKSEMLDRVEEAQPNMVCISATPPAAVIHARYLCKKLHARFPHIPIVVAVWDAQGDMQKASDRLTSVGASTVVGNSAQAMEEITRLCQPLIQGVQADDEVATALEA